MWLPTAIQLLPASLLLFLATDPVLSEAREIPWPFKSLTPTGFFRDGGSFRKELESGEVAQAQILVGVRKMSEDPSELFFPDYWSYEPRNDHDMQVKQEPTKPMPRSLGHLNEIEAPGDWVNASIPLPFQAPFAVHINPEYEIRKLLRRVLVSPRAIFSLDKRQFTCPTKTVVCSKINKPNSCCPSGTTCTSITDTGSGDVGCCEEGQVCSGEVAPCPSGETACSEASGSGSIGGGCCLSGFSCSGVGCVANSTAITVVQNIITAPAPSRTAAGTNSTDPIIETSTATATTNKVLTVTSGSSTTSSRSSSSSSSFSSSSSITAAAFAPDRPISSTPSTTATSTAPPTTITASTCPTGYYQCSAFYHAGCCQVGRNCGLTSCPTASSTTALNSNGVVVAVPTGDTDQGLGQNGCALGWFSCATGEGGGCCPSGYACGTSCTATGVVVQGGATGTAKVAKDNVGGKTVVGGEAGWTLLVCFGLSVLVSG